MQWYYAVNHQRQGPVAQADFDRLVANGAIKPDTLVWRTGMGDWKPYRDIAAPAPTSRPTSQAGAPAVIASASAAAPVARGYGGFWFRVGAWFVDAVIGRLVGLGIAALVGARFATAGWVVPGDLRLTLLRYGTVALLYFAYSLGYEVFFLRKFDATPGKLMVGVKVRRADGAKLSSGRIVARWLCLGLDWLTLGLGYIMAAFDDEKRALHDRICDTRVIKAR